MLTAISRKVRRYQRGDDGAAAVEFALLAPLLLLFVAGIVAFGLVLSSLVNANHAAREGARLAAVGVSDCGVWVGEVEARAKFVDIQSIKLTYPSGTDAGDTVKVELIIDADSGSRGLLAAATSLIPGGGAVFLPDTFTIVAESRAELVEETSCSN